MLKIDDKVFLNIQEAVGWLMANNALPFQCTANYAADTEIPLSDIVNPSPAKVRIGSIIFFADAKAATVMGITEDSFTVGADYIVLEGDIHEVTGDLSVTGDVNVQGEANASDVNASNGVNCDVFHQKHTGSQIVTEILSDQNGQKADFDGQHYRFLHETDDNGDFITVEDKDGNKVMRFRLPFVEAPAGNNVLATIPMTQMENIKDADGHDRFLSIAGTILLAWADTEGAFALATLSGTHLMLVYYGEIEAGELTGPAQLCRFNIPKWLYDKIVQPPFFTAVEQKTFSFWNTIWAASNPTQVVLQKGRYGSEYSLYFYFNSTFTLATKSVFRVQFDLVIG